MLIILDGHVIFGGVWSTTLIVVVAVFKIWLPQGGTTNCQVITATPIGTLLIVICAGNGCGLICLDIA